MCYTFGSVSVFYGVFSSRIRIGTLPSVFGTRVAGPQAAVTQVSRQTQVHPCMCTEGGGRLRRCLAKHTHCVRSRVVVGQDAPPQQHCANNPFEATHTPTRAPTRRPGREPGHDQKTSTALARLQPPRSTPQRVNPQAGRHLHQAHPRGLPRGGAPLSGARWRAVRSRPSCPYMQQEEKSSH